MYIETRGERKVGRLTEMTQQLVSKIRMWKDGREGLGVYFVIQRKEVSNMTLQDISDRIAPCEYIKLIDKGINKVTWCGLGCNIPREYMNKSVTNIYSKVNYDDSGLIIIIE